ncbi:Transglutaminase-like superfamily protein [Actinokineospora alba]|uniref:Transglutaminase-like superfamily protein n=1 Tax=Actinokineospora alba TaxID=504798 RepID=A0A1H0R6E7_9PSEU|nr:transglutaminase-like domain-containing protein [Actinokineospora alba]TDP70228.1 transglutaminase superfamily protein [Actinokineospora alba]SDI36363.1 Transglutaminase-like superfamily protein [Actinokineospora alba]SDP25064.1 Transglutaminase-like superfamily protein [Actinokineospora alba]
MIGAGTSAELAATEFLDHESVEVREFTEKAIGKCADDPRERAAALYLAVRDGVRYEVYGADLSRTGLRASSVLAAGSGMCLHKSVLYAAALRAAGVPSRLVLTDVRNHLASDRLRALVGGDVFRFHCLTKVGLDGGWVTATPVFNKTLCRLYGITPLDFDGTADSMHHPYDLRGKRHMEFLHTHGDFADLPYRLVIDGLRAAHPALFATPDRFADGSLVVDATPATPAPQERSR